MLDYAARRATHNLPDILPVAKHEGITLHVGPQIVDVVTYLAYPCNVPYELAVAEHWTPNSPTNTAALLLTVGPPGHDWTQLIFSFNEQGEWLDVNIKSTSSYNQQQLTFTPSPRHGFSAADAAHLLAIAMEESRRDGWQAWHVGKTHLPVSHAASQLTGERIEHIARLRTGEQVRIEALERLAAEHADEFEEHHEAAQVARALKSDWYPDKRI